MPTADIGAAANALPMVAGGNEVYGVEVSAGVGYRDNATTGVATGGCVHGRQWNAHEHRVLHWRRPWTLGTYVCTVIGRQFLVDVPRRHHSEELTFSSSR